MVDIHNFPDYKISANGEVYSFKYRDTGKLVPSHRQNNGYRFVPLWRNGRQYNRTVHRLLAVHYLPNPYNLPIINHIDGDRENNHLHNLEWCTQSHNVRVGMRGKRKLKQAQVDAIRQRYSAGNIPQRELALQYGVSRSQISHIIRGFSWN
jgi:hypothetical protein